MKYLPLFALAAVAALGLAYYNNQGPTVLGAQTVGGEQREVCWHGIEAADQYQVYFGQEDMGQKDSAVFNGLGRQSRCVNLMHLKPCTAYIWNVNVRTNSGWKWAWASDQRFVTDGVCSAGTATGSVVTNALGKKVAVAGQGTGVASWQPVARANKVYIYYKATADADWSHSVEVPGTSTSYTINYLSPGQQYVYRVAALVDGKLQWGAQQTLTVN